MARSKGRSGGGRSSNRRSAQPEAVEVEVVEVGADVVRIEVACGAGCRGADNTGNIKEKRKN